MQQTESGAFPAWLRRALAAIEFAAAGFCLLGAVAGLTTSPRDRIGGDGIGTGIVIVMGVPFLLSGVGLAAAAFTAWRGRRLWWVWQAALPAWWAAAFAALVISLPEGPREVGRLTTACIRPATRIILSTSIGPAGDALR